MDLTVQWWCSNNWLPLQMLSWRRLRASAAWARSIAVTGACALPHLTTRSNPHRKELMYCKRRGTADKRKHPSVSDSIRFLKFCRICRLSEQSCSCRPWRMHLTRVVLLRASLLLLPEVPGLSTWVTGPANTSLRICHPVTRSDTYYVLGATYGCPQLCLRFMFVSPPVENSALALSRFHSNLGSMGIIHSISCLCMKRHFSFFKMCHGSMGCPCCCYVHRKITVVE